MSLNQKVLNEALSLRDFIVNTRREFHMYPELAFQEKRTSEKVAEVLEKLGFQVRRNVGKTGVVGLLVRNPNRPTVALRADMDALPLQELKETPYKSKVPGVMHACGHDAHTAMLLGAAVVLSRLKDYINGNVKLIFQPAEEVGQGAPEMIKEGVLEDPPVSAIFGLHVWSYIPSGVVGIREGPLLAATGEIELKVKGKGGHGAHPEQTIDPVVVSAYLVTAYQTIVSRNISALDSGVVTISSIKAGEAFNVIPEEAFLKGTYRALTFEVKNLIKKRLQELTDNICRAFNSECSLKLTDSTPPTINHPLTTKIAYEAVSELVGKEKVLTPTPSMGGEDFAYYLEKVPGTFIILGTGNKEKETDKPHHNPYFDVDEDVLPIGSAIYAYTAIKALEKL